MANYTYVELSSALSPLSLDHDLQQVARERFGGRIVVTPCEVSSEAAWLWRVEIPGMNAPETHLRFCLAPGENIGFSVQLMPGGRRIAFRGGPGSNFEAWLRGVVREKLALLYDAPIFSDAEMSTQKVDPDSDDRYDYPNYFAYLSRCWPEGVDLPNLERWSDAVPEGWWDGPLPKKVS